jgi:hypothetical protein
MATRRVGARECCSFSSSFFDRPLRIFLSLFFFLETFPFGVRRLLFFFGPLPSPNCLTIGPGLVEPSRINLNSD